MTSGGRYQFGLKYPKLWSIGAAFTAREVIAHVFFTLNNWNPQFRSKVNYPDVNFSGRLRPGVTPITEIPILVRLYLYIEPCHNNQTSGSSSRFLFANTACYTKHYNTPSENADTWHRSACSIVTLLRKKRLPRIFNNKHTTCTARKWGQKCIQMLHLQLKSLIVA